MLRLAKKATTVAPISASSAEIEPISTRLSSVCCSELRSAYVYSWTPAGSSVAPVRI